MNAQNTRRVAAKHPIRCGSKLLPRGAQGDQLLGGKIPDSTLKAFPAITWKPGSHQALVKFDGVEHAIIVSPKEIEPV